MFKIEYFLYRHKHNVLKGLYNLIFNSFYFNLPAAQLTHDRKYNNIDQLQLACDIYNCPSGNILHDPWINAIDTYCNDQVGDTRHCFDTKEDSNKAQEDHNVAESHCYKEE